MLRRISHIALVFVLLVSTVGLTINFHYCNNEIYDVGLYSEANSCCVDNVHEHHNKSEIQHNCDMNSHKNDCEDESFEIESLDNFITSFYNFNASSDFSIDLFNISNNESNRIKLSYITSEEIPNFNISPPKQQINLAFFQSYLL